jgi:hypothetical protein
VIKLSDETVFQVLDILLAALPRVLENKEIPSAGNTEDPLLKG